jgi:hypothetical protein
MRRRLFTLLSALSLLLCMGTCVLWARSYWWHDTIVFSIRGILIHAELGVGRFGFSAATGYPESEPIDVTTRCMGNVSPDFFLDIPGIEPSIPVIDITRLAKWKACGLSGYFGPAEAFLDPQGHVYHSFTLDATRPRQLRYWEIDAVPYWLVGLLTIAAPLSWMFRHYLRLRHPIGACRNCGYDLRATPDRCPECGTVPPIAKVKA